MITKKHFEREAARIAAVADRDLRAHLCAFATRGFRICNPRFDVKRFARACGVGAECAALVALEED